MSSSASSARACHTSVSRRVCVPGFQIHVTKPQHNRTNLISSNVRQCVQKKGGNGKGGGATFWTSTTICASLSTASSPLANGCAPPKKDDPRCDIWARRPGDPFALVAPDWLPAAAVDWDADLTDRRVNGMKPFLGLELRANTRGSHWPKPQVEPKRSTDRWRKRVPAVYLFR
jgi:hypothetical protein